jgi:hypothetical protein
MLRPFVVTLTTIKARETRERVSGSRTTHGNVRPAGYLCKMELTRIKAAVRRAPVIDGARR